MSSKYWSSPTPTSFIHHYLNTGFCGHTDNAILGLERNAHKDFISDSNIYGEIARPKAVLEFREFPRLHKWCTTEHVPSGVLRACMRLSSTWKKVIALEFQCNVT